MVRTRDQRRRTYHETIQNSTRCYFPLTGSAAVTWVENRRRKRTWYKHYRRLCDELIVIVKESNANSTPIQAERIMMMFFRLYEDMRLHRRASTAKSAAESLALAINDTDLNGWLLRPEARYVVGIDMAKDKEEIPF